MLLRYRLYYSLYLTLSLVAGLVSETPNQCSRQVIDPTPGQDYNLTVPCAKCISTELQFSNGSITSLPVVSAGCAPTTQTDLQLRLSDSVPQGSLNMTIFCLNSAPLCYSFNVVRSLNSTSRQGSLLSEVCSQDNRTLSAAPSPSETQIQGTYPSAQVPSPFGNPSERPSQGIPEAGSTSISPNGTPLGTTPANVGHGTNQETSTMLNPQGSGQTIDTQGPTIPSQSVATATAMLPGNGQTLAGQSPATAGTATNSTSDTFPKSTCLCTS